MRIRKNDIVKIISGKDRGKTGKVIRVFQETGRISIEGINLYVKHIRPKQSGKKGQIMKVMRPLNASNAMILCPVCKKPTRTGYRDNGEKIRFCKKCKAPIR